MPMINLTDPITLLIAVVLFVLVLWFAVLSKQEKCYTWNNVICIYFNNNTTYIRTYDR